MNFDSLLGAIKQHISDFNQSQPSVIGNLLTGQPFNRSIPRFGGVAPENQMVSNPDIASPLQKQDELTPGLVYAMKLNQLKEDNARKYNESNPPSPTPYPPFNYNPAIANAPSPIPNATGGMAQTKPEVLGAATPKNFNELATLIGAGLTKYGAPPNIVAAAPAFAQAGTGLPDPLLPVIMALKETSGGKNITRGDNNIFNMLPTRAGVNYPDVNTAILGGDGHKGFRGIVDSLYQPYLKSGDIADFLATYSPPSENAPLPAQIQTYNDLKKYFQQ